MILINNQSINLFNSLKLSVSLQHIFDFYKGNYKYYKESVTDSISYIKDNIFNLWLVAFPVLINKNN